MGQRQTAFTMVELAIIIVVVALLAAAAVAMYQTYTEKARFSEVRTGLDYIRKAQQVYKLEYGDYPGADARSALEDSGYIAESDFADMSYVGYEEFDTAGDGVSIWEDVGDISYDFTDRECFKLTADGAFLSCNDTTVELQEPDDGEKYIDDETYDSDVYVDGDVTVDGIADVNGEIYATGQVEVKNTATVTGDIEAGAEDGDGDVVLWGDNTVEGDVTTTSGTVEMWGGVEIEGGVTAENLDPKFGGNTINGMDANDYEDY